MIIAVDHPARRILRVGDQAYAMANRRLLLENTIRALSRPGVDGLLASPDVLEDLLLLGELDNKVVFGSMNRGRPDWVCLGVGRSLHRSRCPDHRPVGARRRKDAPSARLLGPRHHRDDGRLCPGRCELWPREV